MLKFEFIQTDEFDDPYFEINDSDIDLTIGCAIYCVREWLYEDYDTGYIDSTSLREIANKLDELNESTRSQRVLGVF